MCGSLKGGLLKHPLAWPLGPGPQAVQARLFPGRGPHPSPLHGTWDSHLHFSFAENTGRLWPLAVLPRSRFSLDALPSCSPRVRPRIIRAHTPALP